MKKNRIISSVILVAMVAVLFAGCGGSPADISLKNAMVAMGKANSVQFDVNFNVTLDDKVMPTDDPSYADFYGYANGSKVTASNKLTFTNSQHTAGLISSDVTWTFENANTTGYSSSADSSPNDYVFNVVTSFDFTNLSKKKPSMTLVQAYTFHQLPQRLWSQIPGSDTQGGYTNKIFSVVLSDNSTIMNFLIKNMAGGVPNWGQMLSTMNWGKSGSNWVLTITPDILKEAMTQMYNALGLQLSDTDKSKVDSLFDALDFGNTNLKYTVGSDGNLSEADWTFNTTLDYYKLNNFVLGRTNGFDIKIPMVGNLTIAFSNWNAVDKFSYPTLTSDNTITYDKIQPLWPQVFPKLTELQTPYTQDQIVVTINGQKVQFFNNLPPVIYNDKVYLPLKYMYQTRGGTVTATLGTNGVWSATATAGVKSAILLQNSNYVNIQGDTQPLSAPVIIHPDYNTLYAPYDLFKLAFDMDCDSAVSKMDDGVTTKVTLDYTSQSDGN